MEHPTDDIVIAPAEFGSAAVQSLVAGWGRGTGGTTVTASDFEPPRGLFLTARRTGIVVGCVGLRPLSTECGEVKRLYVAEPARGMRIGTRLLEALHQEATRYGYRELRLDTHGDPSALALFASAGYRPVPDYNGNELARFWFSRSLP